MKQLQLLYFFLQRLKLKVEFNRDKWILSVFERKWSCFVFFFYYFQLSNKNDVPRDQFDLYNKFYQSKKKNQSRL